LRVKLESATPGPGPSETVVSIQTAAGHTEEVVVHESLVSGRTLAVSKLGTDEGLVLIELPRESVVGNWRIWVTAEMIE